MSVEQDRLTVLFDDVGYKSAGSRGGYRWRGLLNDSDDQPHLPSIT